MFAALLELAYKTLQTGQRQCQNDMKSPKALLRFVDSLWKVPRTETGQGAFSVADPTFWKKSLPLLDDFQLSIIISFRLSGFQTMIRTKSLMYGGTALAAPILFHRVHAAGQEAGGQKQTKCRPSQVFRHSPLIAMTTKTFMWPAIWNKFTPRAYGP